MTRAAKIYFKLKRTYKAVSAKRYSTLAGTLVFFLLLSIIPFVFIITLIFNVFGMDFNVFTQVELLNDYKRVIDFLLISANNASKGVSVFFIITAIYSSTNYFFHMRKSGEIIYGYEHKKGGLIIRVSAAVFVIIITFALLLSVIFLTAFQRLFEQLLPSALLRFLIYVPILMLIYFIIMLLNLYICPYKTGLKNIWRGSLFTIVFWLVASLGFGLYTAYFSNFGRLYGALSFVVVFVLWLYLLMQGLMVGVILNMKYTVKRLDKSY